MKWYETLNLLILVYFLILNGTYILMNILAFFNIRKYYHMSKIYELKKIYNTRFYKPISILVPAFNEEKTIINSVHSMLNLDYPKFEIIVINDGSQDGTLNRLKQEFQLVSVPLIINSTLPTEQILGMYLSKLDPKLIVIDKVNGGKADALNAGLNSSSCPLYCAVDSDTMIDKDSLLKVAQPFIDDPTTLAVGGIIRIVNDCDIRNNQVVKVNVPKNFWAKFQTVEYLRAFLFGRMGWDALKALLIISGAFGLFSKKAVIAAGGYLKNCVGEDMELVVRLHKLMRGQGKKYKITFVPDPVCWTEAPETVGILARQRARWQRGLAETLWKHRKLLFNIKYGSLGMFAYPYFLFFELFGSVIELAGFILIVWSYFAGLISWPFAILFFGVAVVLGVVLSLSSVVLEELFFYRYEGIKQVLILSWYAVIENFFYRQLHTLWRFVGLIQFLTGNHSWGDMKRKGIQKA